MSITGLNTQHLSRAVSPWALVAVSLALSVFFGCTSDVTRESEISAAQKRVTSPMQASNDQLMAMVRSIAAGSDEKSSQAWNALNSYPREEIVTRLQRISKAMPENDYRRVSVAFVLCLLGYDYDKNKSVIVQDLLKEPHHKNPYADWEAELVHRLIVSGDSQLLPTLFEIVPRADGAMAASLSGYLTYHMRNRPEQFLLELKPESLEIRRDVYKRILLDELLTKEQLASMMRYLESVQKKSPTFDVAQEMLLALRKGKGPKQ